MAEMQERRGDAAPTNPIAAELKKDWIGARKPMPGAFATAGSDSSFSTPEADVAADHEQLAVREVDHEQDAVDDRVSEGDERVQAAQRDAVDDLLEQVVQSRAQARLQVVWSDAAPDDNDVRAQDGFPERWSGRALETCPPGPHTPPMRGRRLC